MGHTMVSLDHIRIGILGTGRIAKTLGRSLADAGEAVVAIAGRDIKRTQGAAGFVSDKVVAVAQSELPKHANHILIAIPDCAIDTAAGVLADSGMQDGIVLHTSGALGPEALNCLTDEGVACGVFHPLQTVPSAEVGVTSLTGITYGIAGSPAAQAWAGDLAKKLAGRTLVIPTGATTLYHIAAVMASNAVVGVIDMASALMEVSGVERDRALSALQILAETSVRNAVSLGTENALTGPIERGDLNTIESHLRALEHVPGNFTELYLAVSHQLLDISRRRGLNGTVVSELETILMDSKPDE